MKNALLAVAVASAVLASGARAQDLTGAQVSGAVYCCSAPIETFRISDIATGTVGAGVEFPLGAFIGGSVIPVSIDVGASSIVIDFQPGAGPAAGGLFNGYVLRFTGAPEITGLSLNAASTVAPVGFWHEADAVFINMTGLVLNPSSYVVLDVSAVPEPATGAMLAGGLAMLGWLARRRSAGR